MPRRSAPVQLAFGGARSDPIRELDAMADTIAENATDRRVAFELLENELDHRLRLLVP